MQRAFGVVCALFEAWRGVHGGGGGRESGFGVCDWPSYSVQRIMFGVLRRYGFEMERVECVLCEEIRRGGDAARSSEVCGESFDISRR